MAKITFKFEKKQIPGTILMAGSLAYCIHAHAVEWWAIGYGAMFAMLFVLGVGFELRRRYVIRKILRDKPWLAYLLAIHNTFGDNK